MRPPWDVVGAVSQDPAGFPLRAVRSHQGLDAVRERRRQVPGQAQGAGEPVLGRGGEISGAAARRHGGDADRRAAAEPRRRPHRVHLVRRDHRHAERRRAEHSRRVVQLQGRGRDPAGRRRRHDRDPGRPVRRLRVLPAEGQAGVPVEPRRPASAIRWEGPDALVAGQAHARVRLQVRRPRHRARSPSTT